WLHANVRAIKGNMRGATGLSERRRRWLRTADRPRRAREPRFRASAATFLPKEAQRSAHRRRDRNRIRCARSLARACDRDAGLLARTADARGRMKTRSDW